MASWRVLGAVAVLLMFLRLSQERGLVKYVIASTGGDSRGPFTRGRPACTRLEHWLRVPPVAIHRRFMVPARRRVSRPPIHRDARIAVRRARGRKIISGNRGFDARS